MNVQTQPMLRKSEITLFSSYVAAGFPSPADDFSDKKLDLNEYLIKHPASTFFVRIEGESMKDAGIFPGDLAIVDRLVEPKNGAIILAVVDGEFTIKRFVEEQGKVWLKPENSDYKPIEITADTNFEVWGVVMYVVHQLI